MDPFYKYVAIGALVLLILILTVIGVAMSKMQSTAPFPPTQNACPDYWDVSSNPQYCGAPILGAKNLGSIELDSGKTKIDETKSINIGMCKAGTFGCTSGNGNTHLMSHNGTNSIYTDTKYHYVKLNNNSNWGSMFPGKSERCAQKQWASTLNVTWDGVTNYNSC